MVGVIPCRDDDKVWFELCGNRDKYLFEELGSFTRVGANHNEKIAGV
jgi:hypothetical protein